MVRIKPSLAFITHQIRLRYQGRLIFRRWESAFDQFEVPFDQIEYPADELLIN
jgi:hypothetical protein